MDIEDIQEWVGIEDIFHQEGMGIEDMEEGLGMHYIYKFARCLAPDCYSECCRFHLY